jgi:hypothetical protein
MRLQKPLNFVTVCGCGIFPNGLRSWEKDAKMFLQEGHEFKQHGAWLESDG